MASTACTLTAGQIAGIAVGTAAFVGAIVASLFLLLRKFRSGPKEDDEGGLRKDDKDGPQKDDEGEPKQDKPENRKKGRPQYDLHLIRGRRENFQTQWWEMGTLSGRIATQFCHKKPILQNANHLEESLAIFELDEHTRSRIARLCLEPETRHLALKSLMTRVLTAGMDVHKLTSLSLLPPGLVAFLRSLQPFQERWNDPKDESGGFLVVDMWRRCSARLLFHREDTYCTPHPPLTMIAPQIETLVAAFQQYLQYFYEEPDGNTADLEGELRRLVESAARSAYLVFTEDSGVRFVYEPSSGEDSEIVVLPGINVVTYPRGNALDEPYQRMKPETEELYVEVT